MIFNMIVGGGDGFGAILTVTAPSNVSVTISKDGNTKTKMSDSNGIAEFKGLDSGTWSVEITNGSQTATKTVNITTDFSTTISFFAATISVTYPSGSTCTCTNGSITLTATSTTGSYTFTVPSTGTWTVSCANGSKTDSESISITKDGQSESVTLMYALYLYNNGDQCTAVTGGWTNSSNPLYAKDSSSGEVIPYTNSKVPSSKYSKLCIEYMYTSKESSAESNAKLRLVSKTGSDPTIYASVSLDKSELNVMKTASVDITSVTVDAYLKFAVYYAKTYTYRIWFE